jgi:hypothetical protein
MDHLTSREIAAALAAGLLALVICRELGITGWRALVAAWTAMGAVFLHGYLAGRRVDADEERTERLVNALQEAADADPAMFDGDDEFESVVAEGLISPECIPVYPPPGHSYPRGDR